MTIMIKSAIRHEITEDAFLYHSSVLIRNLFMALLRYATFLAILLRHKLKAHLQGVTFLTIIKSRNIFVARSIARSRIRFYFPQ